MNLTSSAQSAIGKGNVDNKELCAITIPDFHYANESEFGSLSNDERFYKVNGVTSHSQLVWTGTSSGNAQPASFAISRSYSGHDLVITFSIGANIVSTSQYNVDTIISVTRIPFNYAEV
jgi:hypothetical protein